MEPNDVQLHVLTNFQIFIPLSGDADAFVFTQTTTPSFGLILTRTDTNESYQYQLQILQSSNGAEEIISNGLAWAKRTPYQFQKQYNTSIVEALICRLKITSGVFDFRRNKVRSIRFVVRCFSNNVLLSTGISQQCKALPKRRVADEEPDDGNVIIPISWLQDAHNEQSAAVPSFDQIQPVYSPLEEYKDEDSTMANLNDSEEHIQSYSNEGGSEDLALIPTSHTSYAMSELEPVVSNNHTDHYMVLYNGNAEVIGNFRALNFYKASDMRIKEDVRLLIDNEYDPRSVLLKIDGVSYKFKHGTTNAPMNRRFVGYIAQQIESVVPEAVQLIDGILHVDYESLIPYLSESIKQNFRDINEMRADASHIHRVVDMMYAEFVIKEHEKGDTTNSTSTSSITKNQSRNRSVGWIIGTSLTVLMLISIAIGVFLLMPLVHQEPNSNNQLTPEAPTTPSPTPLPSSFPSLDQDVLVEFYHATGGKDWDNGASPSISVCKWPGVSCNHEFRVFGIQMEGKLVGTLPESIGNLDKLAALRLVSEDLYGTIPSSIGNLTSLRKIFFARTRFDGSVPLEIFSLPSLEALHFRNNDNLSWTIPPQISNLKQLQELIVFQSGLHGTLPNEISQLTNLTTLSLSNNNLTGTVPSLANTNVSLLLLANNHFTGPVPKMAENKSIFDHHEELRKFDLTGNSFSGEFDLPLEFLRAIEVIEISNNMFTSVSEKFNNGTITVPMCFAKQNPFKCPIPEWFKLNCKATCT